MGRKTYEVVTTVMRLRFDRSSTSNVSRTSSNRSQIVVVTAALKTIVN